MQRLTLVLLGLLISFGVRAEGNWTIIHAGTLLAVPGVAPKTHQSVIIRDGRIIDVKAGFISPKTVTPDGDVRIVDLSQRFVLPGLMDLHTHLTSSRLDNALANKLRAVTKSDADNALSAFANAKRTLLAGFTTVRNLGSHGRAVFALRDAIAHGVVAGPRILVAGSTISSTGGHGDIHGFRQDVMNVLASPTICDGADSCRRAVRFAVKRGSDWIKIMATGGVLDESNAGTDQQLTDDELRAIVETAHALGRKVAAHAQGLNGINAALRAGVDSIEHGSFLDASSLKLFKQTGAYLVPTLMPPFVLVDKARTSTTIPPAIRAKILSVGPMKDRSVRRALKGGIKIAFGTDAGVYRHGRNAKEFELLVQAGMSEMAAIETATVNAADLLGLSDQIGTIEKGKAADMIAVSDSPLKDITELQRVVFVMRNGRVYKDEKETASQ